MAYLEGLFVFQEMRKTMKSLGKHLNRVPFEYLRKALQLQLIFYVVTYLLNNCTKTSLYRAEKNSVPTKVP
jgi:hypothetical protein